ncbi:bifunctional UDP-sugar hydrolase/5'-nucleotidase [Tessaracoccus sp. OH4464_COT-324]|uniref:bifunctional metallophosphatase/5'-nucleotidase n=1 Tax=Tessaracoccus sp. OH4464_COT-324 TaxID=2491059 RepID=UPI000F637B33|nr:5'-nucleotidase C-terminal domain-containing protein [Tessaracoccus sp. OH4464_COT-324]RRD46755.1 bifunctional metallophosphatase/5'-nucleotidase [Tessaracoccus sp. OH4464_COT-324]
MRRSIALAAALVLGLGALGSPQAHADDTVEVTVLATTDLHGNIFNWDYFRDKPYSDKTGNRIGVAHAASAINQIRAERGAEKVIVVDNGDTIQGSPLATYYAKTAPITTTGETHPMAKALNTIGYDAANVGNHEFNYGLDFLAKYEEQLDAPLLGANVTKLSTGLPAYQPYHLEKRTIDGKEVTVGFLGLTTPGSMVWDRAHLEGVVRIEDMVASAQKFVPQVRAAGADLVVVLSHAGIGVSSVGGLPPENPADDIARKVPGIDAIVIGHTHKDAPEHWETNETTGKKVLISQARYWGSGIVDLRFELTRNDGGWQLTKSGAKAHYSKDFDADPAVSAATKDAHEKTISHVNTKIATSDEELPATESRYRDTPIIDYIQMVQTATVQKALATTEHANLPVLSLAAPFSRTAIFPKGDVTIRDMAGLYIYDNTLEAVKLTGSQVRDFLEYSAKYFADLPPGAAFDPETMTGVERGGEPVRDYHYDIISGLRYEIDLAKPVGQRIITLQMPDGTPVADDQEFVVAINNYRRSGGGNFPHVSTAPVVYNDLLEIRQELIDWAIAKKRINSADFFVRNWRLVINGKPVFADDVWPDAPAKPAPKPAPAPAPDKPGAKPKPKLPKTGA